MADTHKIFTRTMRRLALDEAGPQKPALDLEGAMQELRQKNMDAIQYETALKWASRALASYQLATRAADRAVIAERFTEGDCYRDEALEHAAQVNDDGKLRNFLNKEMIPARRAAFGAVVGG
jgi:hypothetical protein